MFCLLCYEKVKSSKNIWKILKLKRLFAVFETDLLWQSIEI